MAEINHKEKNLCEVLKLCYKNGLSWSFDSIISFQDFTPIQKIPPIPFALVVLEFSNSFNVNKINFEELSQKNFIYNDYKGSQNKIFETHLDLIRQTLNKKNFYIQCMNFRVMEWYDFFKSYEPVDKKENPHLYSNYYPPEHFWGYLGALILLIQYHASLDEKVKKDILINWRDQILNLLDKSYLEQGYLHFSHPLSKYYDRIECEYNEIGSSWLIYIAPFLTPYIRDPRINRLLARLNKLGIYNHRLIERMAYLVEVHNTKQCKIIGHGGYNLYDAQSGGFFYSLKKEMSISLEYLIEYGWVDDLVNKDDSFFLRTRNSWNVDDKLYDDINPEFRKKYKNAI